jgi:hypothetical protein
MTVQVMPMWRHPIAFLSLSRKSSAHNGPAPMRRLPVYLPLDTFGSMSGEAIEQVKNGLQMLASGLRQDPQALETAYPSVTTFDPEAKEVVRLTELSRISKPKAALPRGAALSLVRRKHEAQWSPRLPRRREQLTASKSFSVQRTAAAFSMFKWSKLNRARKTTRCVVENVS